MHYYLHVLKNGNDKTLVRFSLNANSVFTGESPIVRFKIWHKSAPYLLSMRDEMMLEKLMQKAYN